MIRFPVERWAGVLAHRLGVANLVDKNDSQVWIDRTVIRGQK